MAQHDEAHTSEHNPSLFAVVTLTIRSQEVLNELEHTSFLRFIFNEQISKKIPKLNVKYKSS